MANNVLLDETSDVLLSDLCQWLYFNPFSKIINPYHQELHLPHPHGKMTKDVKSPLGKWPRSHHWSEVFWWSSRYIDVALTLITHFDISFGICLHGRSRVSYADYLVDEGSSPWMVSTSSLVDIPQDLVGLIWSQTPQIGLRTTLLI